MKSKTVEMYRPSQYKSWEQASRSGGVYTVYVPEDTLDSTIKWVINVTSTCMSADDPVVWRVKPVELTALQKSFMQAYSSTVNDVDQEVVEKYLRDPSTKPDELIPTQWYHLHDHYLMFVAGYNYKT
jgi:hypothetical protein